MNLKEITKKPFTSILAILMTMAIAIQLLFVPHRVYEVEFSSQNVPHYTSKCIRYNWVGESYYNTYKGEIYITSKIAYDIIAMQIAVTLLITLILYILLQIFIKNPHILKKNRKDKLPTWLSAEQLATIQEDELKQHQEWLVWYTKYNTIRKTLYIGSVVFIIGILLTAYISYSFGINTPTSIDQSTKNTPPNATSHNTTDPNEIRWQKIIEEVTEKENENKAAIGDKISE